MNQKHHGLAIEIYDKIQSAAGAVVRSTAPDRTGGAISNDLEQAAEMLRIATSKLAELRDGFAIDATS